MPESFQKDVEAALDVLKKGGVIVYPTDTIWGIGCDALNTQAIRRIYQIKQRADSKSLIVLIADEREIMRYVAAPDPEVFTFIESQPRPTTVIYPHAIGLPENLIAADGSIALRLVNDPFCRHLIKRLKSPLVSTSANISGEASPMNFKEISPVILNSVDYVVQWRQDDRNESLPSQIIRWKGNGAYEVIRK